MSIFETIKAELWDEIIEDTASTTNTAGELVFLLYYDNGVKYKKPARELKAELANVKNFDDLRHIWRTVDGISNYSDWLGGSATCYRLILNSDDSTYPTAYEMDKRLTEVERKVGGSDMGGLLGL